MCIPQVDRSLPGAHREMFHIGSSPLWQSSFQTSQVLAHLMEEAKTGGDTKDLGLMLCRLFKWVPVNLFKSRRKIHKVLKIAFPAYFQTGGTVQGMTYTSTW